MKTIRLNRKKNMYSILLSLHITFMIVSLATTIGAVLTVALGRRVSTLVMRSDLVVTVVGIAAGAVLLLTAPLSVRCLMLVTYLGVFTLAYRFMVRANPKTATVRQSTK
jgi:hypothetical protein